MLVKLLNPPLMKIVNQVKRWMNTKRWRCLLEDSRDSRGLTKEENFKKRKDSSFNLSRRKIPLFSMSARNRGTSSMIVLNLKRRGLVNKRPILLL
ncbi:hypothetical protein Gogos_021404, partial [Gossypium gossypioides]|nr:hypothetical protein [Gossypium gossypioides]